MELSESGIIEFFDGTYIDLGRIIEITAIRSPTDVTGPFACASFQILYMFQEQPRKFGYEDATFLSQEERQSIFKKHHDMAEAYGGKSGHEMARAEMRERTVEALEKHRAALVEAWKAFRLRNPSTDSVPKVAAE